MTRTEIQNRASERCSGKAGTRADDVSLQFGCARVDSGSGDHTRGGHSTVHPGEGISKQAHHNIRLEQKVVICNLPRGSHVPTMDPAVVRLRDDIKWLYWTDGAQRRYDGFGLEAIMQFSDHHGVRLVMADSRSRISLRQEVSSESTVSFATWRQFSSGSILMCVIEESEKSNVVDTMHERPCKLACTGVM
ncbi:uncharacterized protein CC84DRAFT_1181472 [Paraphaeosphaeria sporulosa]|uniref:Uncharacterized protein n=1 Tax=Paraphaeosphaeria sporulosa TaxID=1460663 RepID=A0A177BVK4_9PLEO|nr:uncharacterized protein CC84DRAFT_1181472 [Paraphaeosphaeria sporulosa]OAF99344.1 hypothetical protein CC84DRAFT_1181472 [Paraphaeosphaeria sporulosa]